MRHLLLLFISLELLLLPASFAHAQPAATPDVSQLESLPWQKPTGLTPFTGTYAAYYRGRPAGDATLSVKHLDGERWEMVMEVRGNRGVTSVLGLNLRQTTVFDLEAGNRLRPLSQTTVRKGLFLGKTLSGHYDWTAGMAHWTGNIDKKRRDPVPLQHGDLSALLINLAVVRDASPGATLEYRFADVGRSRLYRYQADPTTSTLDVQGVSYDALHMQRTNVRPGNSMQFWIVNGIPTPIRIAQQENSHPGIDLQLINYEGD